VSALAKSVVKENATSTPWVNTLASWFSATDRKIDIGLRTHVSCTLAGSKTALFLPPKMATIQPHNLRFLHRLAARHHCRLIEDRRAIDIKPLIENRNQKLSPMMLATMELLKQTGMSKHGMAPSFPNRLNDNGFHIPLPDLVNIAKRVAGKGKRVVVQPSKHLTQLLGGDTTPITGYAAKVNMGTEKITVAYFESPHYRAIGYRNGSQYINHVLLAGGLAFKPEVWAAQHTLIESHARFQLYRSKKPQFDLGLLSVSQFINLG